MEHPKPERKHPADSESTEPASIEPGQEVHVAGAVDTCPEDPSLYDISIDELIKAQSQELKEELESGDYDLFLEWNTTHSTKCRAEKCLVQPFLERRRIWGFHSAYRIKLEAAASVICNPWNGPLRQRFFHVSCLENVMGTATLASYLKVDSYQFHAAIKDWTIHRGKTFCAESYEKQSYAEAVDEYEDEMNFRRCQAILRSKSHIPANYEDGGPVPVKPQLADFTNESMEEMTLLDLLVDIREAGHLLPEIDQDLKILIVEVSHNLPPGLKQLKPPRRPWKQEKEEEQSNRDDKIIEDMFAKG